MRKALSIFLLSAAVMMVLVMVFIMVFHAPPPIPSGPEPSRSQTSPEPPRPPDRILELGPVGTGIENSERVGDLTITIKASRLWVKKSRTFGFDNNLFKKLAARDFELIIRKGDRQLIALSKPSLEMPLGRNTISIEHPIVVFPPDLKPPDRVDLDKAHQRLTLRYRGKEELWDLAKM